MPVYEYGCPKCGIEFEIMRSVVQSDEPAFCPECNSPGQKLVSVFGSKVDFYVRAPAKGAYRKRPGEKKKPAKS